ncbi:MULTISPECIES: hypothetical protein [Paenibacillus]|uniref:hypothetical protein n=1 Tax=Paenibacillus TaxID=44249 RepID=UPI0006CF4B5E|nr:MULTISPECIES: hypothetical protein [Paenibacillus]GCL72881.1 hypothetical protein PN4B1_28080 [Paenibacillus naphthalenovorans]
MKAITLRLYQIDDKQGHGSFTHPPKYVMSIPRPDFVGQWLSKRSQIGTGVLGVDTSHFGGCPVLYKSKDLFRHGGSAAPVLGGILADYSSYSFAVYVK